MRTDRIPAALRRLDGERRALLELSFLRAVSDEELAELLGVTGAEVRRRREAAIERLSDLLGLDGEDERRQLAVWLCAMADEEWAAPSPAGGRRTAARAAVSEPRRRREPTSDRLRARSRARIAISSAALAAGAVAVVATGANEERGSERRASAPGPLPTRAERPARVARTALQPVASARGAGVVRLVGEGAHRRLLLSARGLAPPGRGTYVVWLYHTVDDAVAIGSAARPSFRLNVRLPASAARYPALDVSLEPRDRNEAHGGLSVLRAPLAPLRAAG